jgi:hypothetical protein
LERSALALASAAAGPSYLSDDAVFRERLDALQSRLKAVRAAVLEARRDPLPVPAQCPDPPRPPKVEHEDGDEMRQARPHTIAHGESSA